jgi:tetratricopeptide (TPR) repeat protein
MTLNATNPILNALSAGNFAAGLEQFNALEAPTPEDLMWSGQCCVLLGQPLAGLERLLEARVRGLEDALGLIAFVYRRGGESERANTLLNAAKTDRLNPFGEALLLHEKGMLALQNGRLKIAVRHLDQAFEIALIDPITGSFMGSIATSAADALSRLGRDARMLAVVAHALPTASPPQRAQLLLMRAFSFMYAGKLREAERDLEETRTNNSSAILPPMEKYTFGVLRRFQGSNQDAAQHFLESAALARAQDQPEIEFYAEIALSRLSTGQDEIMTARAHLARARGLADGMARCWSAWTMPRRCPCSSRRSQGSRNSRTNVISPWHTCIWQRRIYGRIVNHRQNSI